MLQKIDIKDISNISHNHPTVSQPQSYSNVEKKLTTTAKTLLYLFSPQIDLLQTLQNKVEHYDKFQRTKLILKQLINSVHYRFDRETGMMKTEEEISKILYEFEHLKNIAEVLHKENDKKSLEIQNLKQIIIKLTKAYQQARFCYQQELLQIKFECDYLRSKFKNQRKDSSLSRQKKQNDQYSINLKLPKERKRKESQKYTDRKMYVRFSASNIQQNDNVVTSMAKDEEIWHNRSQTHNCSHFITINQLQVQKEALQRKIQILEQQLRKISDEKFKQSSKLVQKYEYYEKQNQIYQKQLKVRECKLVQKNKIINQLLKIIQNDG